MTKEELIKLRNDKVELKERTARVYDQITGQIALLDDLIRANEEKKEEVKE